jgi:hypothetical protein
MSDEIRIQVSLPLDDDGFLRRECPRCEREFKWFIHSDGDENAEFVDQYFCPLCGQSSGPESWWTPAQLEHAQRSAGPEIDRILGDGLDHAFRGVKGLSFTPDPNFSLEISTPEPMSERNDMAIVGPPCHPSEPIKVPEEALTQLYCLICGERFAAV